MWRKLALAIPALILSFEVAASDWFDLAAYRALKGRDAAQLEFVLGAMYESVFFAQESVGQATVCASPLPVSGAHLMALIDYEIAHPSHPTRKRYQDNDHVAFVLEPVSDGSDGHGVGELRHVYECCHMIKM